MCIDCALEKSQIVFNYVGSAVAVGALLAVFWKRKDIFKTSLYNKQFDEMGHIRKVLFEIWNDIFYVNGWAKNINDTNGSIVDFEKNKPEEWQQYQRYKNNSYEMFHKLSLETYYLFPPHFDISKVAELNTEIEKYAPFTINSLINKSGEDIYKYQDLLLGALTYFDEILKH